MIKAATEYALGDLSKCPHCKSYLDQGIPHGLEHLRVCANCKEVFWPLPAGYVKILLADVDDKMLIFVQSSNFRFLVQPCIRFKSAMKSNVAFLNDYGDIENARTHKPYDERDTIAGELKRIEPVLIINQGK